MEKPLPESPDTSLLKADYRCPHCAAVVKGLIQYYGHISYWHEPSRPLVRGKRMARVPLASELLEAMERARAGLHRAARELGVSKPTFVKWATILIPEQLEEYRKRPLAGIGMVKGSIEISKLPAYKHAQRVLSGEIAPPKYWTKNPHRSLKQLFRYGLLADSCSLCGFSERRLTDYRVPLLLDFVDGNQANWQQANLRVLCYNCYFLNVHDMWGKAKTIALS